MTFLSILLKVGFVPKVKTGDDIVAGQVVAERTVENDEKGDLPKLLGVSPQKVLRYLTKRPGDRVEKGAIVAFKKGALGIGGKKVASPVRGTIFKFDEETGLIYIREDRENAKAENLFSPVDGVVELCDNKKIVIKTGKDAILADKVCGKGIIQGQLVLIGRKEVDSQDLDGEVEGKIILGKAFQREAISKSFGIGALGIISQNISDEELEDLRKKNINTPVFIINEENFGKLSKYKGKKIYADAQKYVIIPL